MKLFPMIPLLLLLSLAFSPSVQAQKSEPEGLSERQTRLLYGEFNEIRSFGMIAASLVGDAESIGLNEQGMTEYIKARFKAYFAGMPFEDISKDSRRFLALLGSRDRRVGNITVRIWVVGVEYPVVYHVRCDAGNFSNPSIWSEEILGHGSKKSAPEAIREIVDEMIKSLATHFFRARGQSL